MIDNYKILKIILAPVIRWMWQGRVEGINNVPLRGSAIVAANHASYVDFLLLSAVLPRRVTFLAKSKLFHSQYWRWLMIGTGQIQIGGNKSARKSLTIIRAHANNDRLLGIFPEGTRSRSGEISYFHTSVIKLSRWYNIPIIPVRIVGSHYAWSPMSRYPKRHPCDLVIGCPFYPGNNIDHETELLRQLIMELHVGH